MDKNTGFLPMQPFVLPPHALCCPLTRACSDMMPHNPCGLLAFAVPRSPFASRCAWCFNSESAASSPLPAVQSAPTGAAGCRHDAVPAASHLRTHCCTGDTHRKAAELERRQRRDPVSGGTGHVHGALILSLDWIPWGSSLLPQLRVGGGERPRSAPTIALLLPGEGGRHASTPEACFG